MSAGEKLAGANRAWRKYALQVGIRFDDTEKKALFIAGWLAGRAKA